MARTLVLNDKELESVVIALRHYIKNRRKNRIHELKTKGTKLEVKKEWEYINTLEDLFEKITAGEVWLQKKAKDSLGYDKPEAKPRTSLRTEKQKCEMCRHFQSDRCEVLGQLTLHKLYTCHQTGYFIRKDIPKMILGEEI